MDDKKGYSVPQTDSYEYEPVTPNDDTDDYDPTADYSVGLDEQHETREGHDSTEKDFDLSEDVQPSVKAEAAEPDDNNGENDNKEEEDTITAAEGVPAGAEVKDQEEHSDTASAGESRAETIGSVPETESRAETSDSAPETENQKDSPLENETDETSKTAAQKKDESMPFLDDYKSHETDADDENRARRKKHPFRILFLIVIILVAAVYGYGAYYFRNHFQFNTTASAFGRTIDISGWTQQQLDDSIGNFVEDYSFTITDIQGNSYKIEGSDISYTSVGDEKAETLLSTQNPYKWPISLIDRTQLALTLTTTYDEEALRQQVSALDFMQDENMTAPVNASVAITADGYEVKDAIMGTTVLKDQILEEAVAAVDSGETSLTLTDSDYLQPEILADDESITDFTGKLDQYLNSSVTYDIEGADEQIDKSMIMGMLDIDTQKETVSLNEDAVTAYVQTLATKYNTYGSERQFKTSLGDTITIGGGDYGWVVSKSGEKEQLLKDLQSGESVGREPVYEQTAVQRATKEGETDIGNTYIEIDYTNQHIYYYKDGELQLDSDIVSGNTTIGNGSPDGIFKINYKKSPAVLVGEDYQSDVTYFMVFSYNVGIHDASWRSSFGGSIYTSDGSHGCVNVPLSFAENLYEVLAEKTPVVAYYRNSVTLTSENARIANAYSYSK